MRSLLTYFLLVLLLGSLAASCRKHLPRGGYYIPPPDTPVVKPPPPVETEPAVLKPVSIFISTNIQGYYEALPAKYHENSSDYPLIIFFHGGGQYGNGSTDLHKVLRDGIPKLLEDKVFPPSFQVGERRFSFVVLIPQMVNFPTNQDMDAMVEYAKSNYRVDPGRIYLVGFSMGGRMAGNYAAAYTQKVAASITMGGLIQVNPEFDAKCKRFADGKLPVWHFHNRYDEAWYYFEAERMVNTINSFNPSIPPRLTTFEESEGPANHDCWTRASNPEYKEEGKNIYEWMLQFSREP